MPEICLYEPWDELESTFSSFELNAGVFNPNDCVTGKFQILEERSSNYWLRKGTNIFSVLFSLFMICGRLLCGVHWCTDIIGGVLLSFGLFGIYRGATLLCCRNQ